MKVLLINGSPRREGNTFIALSEAARALEAEGVGAEIVSIGTKAVQGCIACGKCAELGRCVFNDALYNEVREKLVGADALVVGSPVYYIMVFFVLTFKVADRYEQRHKFRQRNRQPNTRHPTNGNRRSMQRRFVDIP